MKKALSILIVCMMVVSLLAACGGDATSTNPDASAPSASTSGAASATGEEVTLRFMWWGGDARHEATIAAIERYQELNPNVKIETEYTGYDGYETKVKTMISAGTAPDLIQLDSIWMADLNKNSADLFVDLSQQANMDLSGFDMDFVNSYCLYNDKVIGVPSGVNAQTNFVNSALADELGLDYSKHWTWDEIISEGERIHSENADYYLYALDLLGLVRSFQNLVGMYTGNQLISDDGTLGFTADDAAKALGLFEEAWNVGALVPLEDVSLYNDNIAEFPMWGNGQIVFTNNYSSGYDVVSAYLPEGTVMETTYSPTIADAKDGCAIVRPAQIFSVNAGSANVEATVDFLNWFVNDEEAAHILGIARSVPASSYARETLATAGELNEAVERAVNDALPNAQTSQSGLDTNSEIVEIITRHVESVGYGTSAADAAEAMVSELTDKAASLV